MFCPLLAHKTYIPDDFPMQVYEECLKEGCAWWEPNIGKCSVLQMWISLQDIHEVLHDNNTAIRSGGNP